MNICGLFAWILDITNKAATIVKAYNITSITFSFMGWGPPFKVKGNKFKKERDQREG